MSKETKNHEKEPVPVASLKASLSMLKQSLSIQPILAFLKTFDVFFRKKERFLKSNEVLFSPGENPYFYIVSGGALSILRTTPTGEKKEVGRAYTGSFLGE